MMNLLEEAIIYATIMHQGQVRKFGNSPAILHSMEVAQILSTMTDDQELLAAGILHDVVEDTDGTLEEIEKRFGKRVAELVASESEEKYPGEEPGATWKRRKEASLLVLRSSRDIGVKKLWLADKLANIRSLAGTYSEMGEAMWSKLHQSDPETQRWYYRSIAEIVELSLNKTGAFKELIKHINSIWPGTFDSEKAKYRKYREVSVDGCRLLGRGAKGDVYRYDDELVIKVYNQNNTYHDVEREIALARKAFVLGLPTAISFGIVDVGDRYGSMYELVDSETVSSCIARNPGQVETYAKIMAELAHTVHAVAVTKDDGFQDVSETLLDRVRRCVAPEDAALARRCEMLIEAVSPSNTLIHGDFHTGNVFLQNGEPLLIDMDRVSRGHPIVELSDLYVTYMLLGEDEPAVVENFMGFSYQTATRFFRGFLKHYLGTEDTARLEEVAEKAALLGNIRMIHKLRKKKELSEQERKRLGHYLGRISNLTEKLDTLAF